jgi:hypothetical protein
MTKMQQVGHDRRVTNLTTLTGRWWDWEVRRWDPAALTLVADNDLTYHWSVEVSFVGVVWVAIADSFSHPVFRQPTGAELDFVRQIVDDGEGLAVFAWDAETTRSSAPMLVAAQHVRVTEGLVRRV